MIWLGYKEFIRRIFTNIFIALQLAAMLFIVISIVSSVNSRTELYLPIKDKLEGDGLYLQASQITFADVATEEELLKLHPEIKDVTCAYTFSFLEKENSVSAYSMAYSDEIIEMYEPKLKSGKWFNLKNNDDDVLYAITDDKHDLPVEAHSSNAYIQLYPDGNFKMLRLFDSEHYLIKEIGYHPESQLDTSRKPILHVHEYPVHDNFSKRTTRLMTEEEYEKYKKYFGGIIRWKLEK